jgi:hypothetical protein
LDWHSLKLRAGGRRDAQAEEEGEGLQHSDLLDALVTPTVIDRNTSLPIFAHEF